MPRALSQPPIPANVEAAFGTFDDRARDTLEEIRSLIFQVAQGDEAIGPLTETLKWGQPAYLTEATKSGTTIRLGAGDETISLFVHCQSRVAEQWRAQYGDQLTIIGDRELRIDRNAPLPVEPLRHCIAMALRYRVARARGAR